MKTAWRGDTAVANTFIPTKGILKKGMFNLKTKTKRTSSSIIQQTMFSVKPCSQCLFSVRLNECSSNEKIFFITGQMTHMICDVAPAYNTTVHFHCGLYGFSHLQPTQKFSPQHPKTQDAIATSG